MTSPLQAQYDKFTTSPDLGRLLMAGDPGAVRAFHDIGARLHGIEPAPAPDPASVELTKPGAGAAVDLFALDAAEKLSGISAISGPHAMSDRQKLDMIDTMRRSGAKEDIVREAMDDTRAYSPELVAYCQDHWNDLAGDSSFRAALFRGETWAYRKWHAWCVVASGNVKA